MSIGDTIQPHGLYLLHGMAMNHRRYIAWYHSTAQVAVGTWRAADCRPYGFAGGFYLCACCSYNAERRTAPHPPPMAVPLPRRGRFCVVPFNRTGCIRNVAGGRLPPLRTHRWVIPFIRTGCICSAPGTAHRPFPTVSLIGSFFEPTYSKSGHVRPSNNCQLSIVNCQLKNCQLISPVPQKQPAPFFKGRL